MNTSALSQPRPAHKVAAVAHQINTMRALDMPALWALWDEHFPKRPTHPNRKNMEARLAYRIQEVAFGGLPNAARDALVAYGQRLSNIKVRGLRAKPVVLPGTTLRRDFDGREHCVKVLADGRFEYAGRAYRSLSAIAKVITGTQWSGPAFFGVTSKG
jgi:hypothetical protein